MKKQLVTYKIAKELKELGFKERCYQVYWDSRICNTYETTRLYSENPEDIQKTIIAMPLWQQVEEWLRGKHGILIDIDFAIGWGYGYIPVGCEIELPLDWTENFSSYELARKAAILRVLSLLKK